MTNELTEKDVLRLNQSESRVNLCLDDDFETIWMSQDSLSDFYKVSKRELRQALVTVFEGLDKAQHTRRVHFVERQSKVGYESQYSLAVILRVAFCFSSNEAVAVQAWAFQHLERLLTKGFCLDKARVSSEKKRLALFQKQSASLKI